MCGIYGELSVRPGYQAGEHAEAAVDLLEHRGPDDRGSWRGDGIFLGARRLSIIDPRGGGQPMWSRQRERCVVFNGELYNFADLRGQLERRGHVFDTASDTEVVLQAYEEWGPGCVTRFNGMFAFAIWDAKPRTLFMARDRIGEKPLYYHRDARRLAFASETKAIFADPAVPRSVNPRGLANYLAFGHALAPETMYAGVHKLLPGHTLLACDDKVTIEPYWNIAKSAPHDEAVTEDEYAERLLTLLDDSVKRRLVADVPVGALLSGGLDSSAVVALMIRHAPSRVMTFAAGFEADGVEDELADASLVARALGTEHHEVRLAPGDVAPAMSTLAYHYDEPFADPAALSLLVLSRLASSHVKVALTGDGGDELFGGYRRYVFDQLAPAYQRLPGALTRHAVPAAAHRLPGARRIKRLASTLAIADPADRYARWLRVLTPDMLAELLLPDAAAIVRANDPDAGYPRHYAHLNGSGAGGHLNRLMYVDVKSWLADGYMEKADKATMACSLEARMPLLDHRVVELAFEIPGNQKIRGLATKRILRRAIRGHVPDHVLRRRKQGFTVPIDRWLRVELAGWARELLLDERARGHGYFDHKVLERMLDEHARGRHVHSDALWLLLNFELWHRIYLDRESM